MMAWPRPFRGEGRLVTPSSRTGRHLSTPYPADQHNGLSLRGKYRTCRSRKSGCRGASIRPRLYYRGNGSGLRLRAVHQLRFNSATALLPWKFPENAGEAARVRGFNSATALLPWKLRGRALARPGVYSFNSATALLPWKYAPRLTDQIDMPYASIRPRLYYRGNVRQEKTNVRVTFASIRPRLYYRGN